MKNIKKGYLIVSAVFLIMIAGALTLLWQNMKKNPTTYRMYVTQEDDYTWALSIADENIVRLISYGQSDDVNFATEGEEDYLIELEPLKPGKTKFTMDYEKKFGDGSAEKSYTYEAVVGKDMVLDLKLKEGK